MHRANVPNREKCLTSFQILSQNYYQSRRFVVFSQVINDSPQLDDPRFIRMQRFAVYRSTCLALYAHSKGYVSRREDGLSPIIREYPERTRYSRSSEVDRRVRAYGRMNALQQRGRQFELGYASNEHVSCYPEHISRDYSRNERGNILNSLARNAAASI